MDHALTASSLVDKMVTSRSEPCMLCRISHSPQRAITAAHNMLVILVAMQILSTAADVVRLPVVRHATV